MNHSMYSADQMTHLKIVVIVLVAGIGVAGFGIAARIKTGDGYTQTATSSKRKRRFKTESLRLQCRTLSSSRQRSAGRQSQICRMEVVSRSRRWRLSTILISPGSKSWMPFIARPGFISPDRIRHAAHELSFRLLNHSVERDRWQHDRKSR